MEEQFVDAVLASNYQLGNRREVIALEEDVEDLHRVAKIVVTSVEIVDISLEIAVAEAVAAAAEEEKEEEEEDVVAGKRQSFFYPFRRHDHKKKRGNTQDRLKE